MKDGKARKRRNQWRAFKFAVIRRVLVPLTIPLVKVWMRTLRLELEPPTFHDDLTSRPGRPVVVAMLHETPMAGLAGLSARSAGENARFTVLVSPSRDGQLQGAVMRSFGVHTVDGSSSKRGVAGLLGLRRALDEGCTPVIAIDGPTGPRGVPKPGVFALASSAKANLVLVAVGATPQWRLRTWDRFLIPPPFSLVRVAAVPFHDYAQGPFPGDEAAALQELAMSHLVRMGQPLDGIPAVEKA